MQLPETFAVFGEVALCLCVGGMALVFVYTQLKPLAAQFEEARRLPLEGDELDDESGRTTGEES